MRFTLGATIIALLMTASLQAQVRTLSIRELVELSRLERERQATAPAEGRVYTSEDLRRFVPAGTEGAVGPDGRPIDDELASALEDLGAAFTQFGTESAGPASDLVGFGEGLSGSMVEMLEEFEAGIQIELGTLQGQLSDPTLTAQERADIQAEISDGLDALNEVRTELASARQQQTEFSAVGDDFDAFQEEFGLVPGVVGDSEEAWTEWQAGIEAMEARIQALEDQDVEQQLAMTDIRSVITGPTGTQQERNQARDELADADAALTRLREELARAEAELILLEGQEPGL